VITINTCIDIFVKAGEFENAWNLFEAMSRNYGVDPDNYSYAIIIKALRSKPDSEKLSKVLKVVDLIAERKNKDVLVSKEFEESLFNCLIEICFKLRDIATAEKLLETMKALKVIISNVTYSIMIKGYGACYQKEKAVSMFNNMRKEGLFPNDVVYGCVLNACVRCGDMVTAKKIFQEMKGLNYAFNLYICSTMIKGFGKEKDFSSAYEIYQSLVSNKNINLTIVVYNSILEACVQCGKFEKMKEIFNGLTVQPDLITLSTMIKGYSKSNNMKEIITIYKNLKEKQAKGEVKLDEVFYNTLLDACCYNYDTEKGLEIIEDMKSNKIALSNVTYSIIIKLYSRSNEKIEKVFEIVEEMKQKNVFPGLIVYTCLIQCCMKTNNFIKANSIFEELKSQKIKPDHVIYLTLIKGCMYNKEINSAYDYMCESFSDNVRMSDDIYNKFFHILLSKYTNLKQSVKLTYCEKVYSLLKARKFVLEDATIRRITEFICKAKGISSAVIRK